MCQPHPGWKVVQAEGVRPKESLGEPVLQREATGARASPTEARFAGRGRLPAAPSSSPKESVPGQEAVEEGGGQRVRGSAGFRPGLQ